MRALVSDEYVAGLLDGEGYVSMVQRQRREPDRRSEHDTEILVAVTMVERAPLDALAERFGGGVYLVAHGHKRWRDAYRYQVTGRLAEGVLRAARPYMLVKHRQADLCLEQRENLLVGGKTTPERAAHNARVQARRVELLRDIRELNRRGKAA